MKPKAGLKSVPHEKTSLKVYEKVRNALEPPVDDQILQQMCRDDELTTWFGRSFSAVRLYY